jgi:hypothetical protein
MQFEHRLRSSWMGGTRGKHKRRIRVGITASPLEQGGFWLHVTANGYRDVTMGVTLTTNTVTDVQLPPLLARLVDIAGTDIGYDRVPGGFEMYAMGENAGEACATQISGVTTIRNTAPPNLTLDFSWSVPTERIVQPGERFEYHAGFMTDAQAFQFPEGAPRPGSAAFQSPARRKLADEPKGVVSPRSPARRAGPDGVRASTPDTRGSIEC